MLKTIKEISYYSSPNLESSPEIVHAFLGRTGGVSSGHLASLNLGRREEDSAENLAENKRRAVQTFGIDSEGLITVSQVHGDNIIVVDSPDTSPHGIKSLDADGLITNIKGMTIGILTADCVPVILYDGKNKVIAAVHAGWKGTAAKIAVKTVEIMAERYKSRPQEITAAIGPAIGPCCYKVGEDVVAAVGHREEAAELRGCEWYLNLQKANFLQLQGAGVADIDLSDICTSCRTDLFFSHRAEQGKTGRQLSFISLR